MGRGIGDRGCIAVAGVTGYHFAARRKTSASPPVIVNAQGQAAPRHCSASFGPEWIRHPGVSRPQVCDPPQPKPVSSATAAASKKISSLPAAPTPSQPTGSEAATPSLEPPVAATAPADTATTNTNHITKEGPCEKIKQACLDAGFVFRGAKAGNGFATDCTIPIIQGTPQPATATFLCPTSLPGS